MIVIATVFELIIFSNFSKTTHQIMKKIYPDVPFSKLFSLLMMKSIRNPMVSTHLHLLWDYVYIILFNDGRIDGILGSLVISQ